MAYRRAPGLLVLVAVLATAVVAPVGAEPGSDEIEGEIQSAEQRLQELEMEAALAVEDYNEATVALEELNAEMAATEEELDRLADEVAALTDAAGEHARMLYKLGPTVELSSLLVATEGSDLGDRTITLRRIMDAQRADVEELLAANTSLEAAEARLAEQQAQAAEHEAELADRRDEVEALLGSHEEEIATLEAELAEARDREAEEERRRQAELEAQREAEREAERQAEREAEQRAQQQAQQTASSEPAPSQDTGSSSPPPAPSTRQSASVAVQTAIDQIGKPYRFGANGPDAYDCSGLTSYAWRAAGVDITRTSRSQWHATKRVSRGDLQPGDLVFYSSTGTAAGIGHVAMYVGGGDIVEASRSGVPVRRSSSGLSRSDILGYGRP